jgi:hypothetical protein
MALASGRLRIWSPLVRVVPSRYTEKWESRVFQNQEALWCSRRWHVIEPSRLKAGSNKHRTNVVLSGGAKQSLNKFYEAMKKNISLLCICLQCRQNFDLSYTGHRSAHAQEMCCRNHICRLCTSSHTLHRLLQKRHITSYVCVSLTMLGTFYHKIEILHWTFLERQYNQTGIANCSNISQFLTLTNCPCTP